MQNTRILKKRSAGEFLLNYALYIILGAILVGVSIARPNFLKVDNIMQILKQASTKGILALGCAGLIVLAGTDLSIGRVLGLSAAVCASLVQRIDYPSRYYPQMVEQLNPFFLPLLAAVVVAVVISLINGFGVAHLKMHAFIITLGMQLIAFGANCLYIEGQSAGSAQALATFDRNFLKISGGSVVLGDIVLYYVPLILLLAGILTWVIGNLTPAGKRKLRKLAAGRLVIPFAALYLLAAAVLLWIALGIAIGASHQAGFLLGSFVVTDVKIPFLVLIFLGIAGIMWVIWNKTRLGKNMFAVGGNQEAAAVSGVNVARTIMLVYLMAGILYRHQLRDRRDLRLRHRRRVVLGRRRHDPGRRHRRDHTAGDQLLAELPADQPVLAVHRARPDHRACGRDRRAQVSGQEVMKWQDPVRDNQLRLQEEAKKRGGDGPREPRKPWRESVYGGLKGKISVRTMDAIIWSIVALIAAAVIVGIAIR